MAQELTDGDVQLGAGARRRGREGSGEEVDRRRSFFSSTSCRRQLEGGAGTPGTAARPGARRAPASSNREANCWETMSRREREVVCIFPFNNGGL
jgi:hypothetical protein